VSIFRRFSMVLEQRANAAADRMEDPAQALDLSYEKLLEEQQRLRRALVDAAAGQKRLENQAAELDARIARLNSQAQAAVQVGRDDLAQQALTQAAVLQQQRDGLVPQLTAISVQVSRIQEATRKYDARLAAFQSQRETLKSQYAASTAVSHAGESLAGIGEHMADTSLMIQRAQDRIAGMTAHADAVDQLLDSGDLDVPGIGGSALDAKLAQAAIQGDVTAKLAAMKAKAGLAAPAADGAPRLTEGIIVRVHGEGGQYRIPATSRQALDATDRQLVAAVRAQDSATYHSVVIGLLSFVHEVGLPLPASEIRPSDIVLPSADMTLPEVADLLAGEGWLETPAAATR
jgi:phage shock protein A